MDRSESYQLLSERLMYFSEIAADKGSEKFPREFEESIVIRGSSYFVSQRTADRLGFRVSRTSMPEKINIVLNYLDLVWMYSMTNGKAYFAQFGKYKHCTNKRSRAYEASQCDLLLARSD